MGLQITLQCKGFFVSKFTEEIINISREINTTVKNKCVDTLTRRSSLTGPQASIIVLKRGVKLLFNVEF
jgi:hypothetical protein